MIWGRKNWNRLNQMLEKGIQGEFQESRYDETELSRLESKWKQFLEASSISRAKVEQEKAHIKELVSDISHQTKTPVANIQLYSELLEERLREKGDSEDAMLAEQIRRQAEKLEFLIQSLTKMSRLESSILELHPSIGNIGNFLEEVREEILPKAERKKISITIESSVDFQICYDRKWTGEALYNVLDNGVKYSPEGSELVIRAKEYELYGCISVTDQGIGISEEEMPKIFQRFYRSEQVQQQDGVGIGLYLTREILKKQSGYVKVDSETGKGSTFSLYLPRNSF